MHPAQAEDQHYPYRRHYRIHHSSSGYPGHARRGFAAKKSAHSAERGTSCQKRSEYRSECA
ncbi:hypothetical protein ppKF707_3148 [Metapseudomonas furukawaii]|nr:hypothetical protein ppKF707_3148 [Pseudomonas furukawaii]